MTANGANSARQSVGLPGHCDDCAARGHIAAHPSLGCSDVGCTSPHEDLPSAPDWSGFVSALETAALVRPYLIQPTDGATTFRWVDDDTAATQADIAAEQELAAQRVEDARQAFSMALGNAYAPNLSRALQLRIFDAAYTQSDRGSAQETWAALPHGYEAQADLANQAHAEGARLAASPLDDNEWASIEAAHRTLSARKNDSGSPLCEAIEKVITGRATTVLSN